MRGRCCRPVSACRDPGRAAGGVLTGTAPVEAPSGPRLSTRPVAVVTALSIATFVSALDNTVVNVALPRIQADLQVPTRALEWVVTAYVLTFASLMFLGGRLADRWGRRATFVTGLLVFALASGGAALATSSEALVAARAVQGVGAALLLPASLSILGADVSVRARQLGAGIATAAAAVALALGPLLGGIVSEHWHWHGIFLINLPIVAVCLALTWWAVPSVPGTRETGRLGLRGIVTAGVAVSSVVWLFIEAAREGWTSPATLGVAGVGVAAVVVFVVLARTGHAAIVDGPLLRNRVFGGAVVASTLWGLGVNGVFFFTSLYLQGVLRLAPATAGLVFLPLAIALVVVVAFVGPIVGALGSRAAVALGLLLVAVGLWWVSTAGVDAGVSDLVPALAVIGLGSGLTVPLTAIALDAVDVSRMGMASSLVTASREVAGALGVAGVGAVVAARSGALAAGGADARLTFLGGYEWGLRVAAGVVLVGAVVAACTLTSSRPADVLAP